MNNKGLKKILFIILFIIIGIATLCAVPHVSKLVNDAGGFSSYGGGGGYSGGSYSSGGSYGGNDFDFDFDFDYHPKRSQNSNSTPKELSIFNLIEIHLIYSIYAQFICIPPLAEYIEKKKKRKKHYINLKLQIARIIIFSIIDLIHLGLGAILDLIICSLCISFYFINGKNHQGPTTYEKELSLEELKEFGIDNVQLLKEQTYNVFKEIEVAWMNFDYPKLEQYCTDELYNTYKSELEIYKLKNQKNIMEDFKFIDCIPYKITKENNITNLSVILNIEMNDYIIDTKTELTIKGHEAQIFNMTYDLTFVRKDTLSSKYCPNCGAEVKNEKGTKCPYCNSQIVNIDTNWQMSQKKLIKQINRW